MNKTVQHIKNQLDSLQIDYSDVVVTGSTVWEYFEIGNARDLDIIVSDNNREFGTRKKNNIASKEVMINNVVGVGRDKFAILGIQDNEFFKNSELTIKDSEIKFVKPEIEFSKLVLKSGFRRDFYVTSVTKSLIKNSSYPWDWSLVLSTSKKISISKFRLFIFRLTLIFQNPSKLYIGIVKRLKKYIKQSPKLTNDFQDIGLFLLNQFNGNTFNRFDILMRYKLIESNFKNNEYLEAYKLMQINRMKLSENDASRKLEIFKNLFNSILDFYREDQSPIEINKDFKLTDGSHRAAIHLLQGSINIPIKITKEKTPKYSKDWFIHNNFNPQLLADTEDLLNKLLIEKGSTFNCIIWQGGSDYLETIKELISEQHEVKLVVSNVSVENFNKFLIDIYKTDNLEDWKILYKLNKLNKLNSKTISMISFLVLNPDWRLRENTNSLISKKVEFLKAEIRNEVSKNSSSHIDTILHIGDNTKQNRHIYETFISYGLIENEI